MGDWGMAATTGDADYVGQVGKLLSQTAGVKPHLARIPAARLEMDPDAVVLSADLARAANSSQLVVIQLGDNVKPDGLAAFEVAYARLLHDVRPAHGVLVCLSRWWADGRVDAAIDRQCRQAQGRFVPIGDISADPRMRGLPDSEGIDPGVQAHPSDLGMALIARRVVSAWSDAIQQVPLIGWR